MLDDGIVNGIVENQNGSSFTMKQFFVNVAERGGCESD